MDKRKAIRTRILSFKWILKVKNEEKYKKVNNQKLRTKIHLKYGKLIWNILSGDKYEKQ